MSIREQELALAKQEANNEKLKLAVNIMGKMEAIKKHIADSFGAIVGKDVAKGVNVQFMENIHELNRFIMELSPIMGYPGDKMAHNILMYMTNRLEDVIDPQIPYDFKSKKIIRFWKHYYLQAVRLCMGKHAQKWDEALFKLAMEVIGDID